MRRVLVAEIEPGMVLEEEVSDPGGLMTLGQGTILTESWIERIRSWKIGSIVIQDELAIVNSDEELQNILQMILAKPEEFAKIKPVERTSRQKIMSIVAAVEVELSGIFLRARCTGTVPVDELERLAYKIIYPLLSAAGVFLFVHSLTRAENYLYRHAVDSAILAGLMARWLELPEEDVRNLVFAGLVQDIGKSRVYFELLTKPGPLTVPELMRARSHVYYSHKILSETQRVSSVILEGILQHHERMDGSGYASSLQQDQIGKYGRILAVVDVYAALISNRYYKGATSPIEATEMMLTELYGHFDPQVLSVFCERLRHFLIGENVVLSNGDRGTIAMFHAFPEMRPLVHSMTGMVVDLLVQRDIHIERLDIG